MCMRTFETSWSHMILGLGQTAVIVVGSSLFVCFVFKQSYGKMRTLRPHELWSGEDRLHQISAYYRIHVDANNATIRQLIKKWTSHRADLASDMRIDRVCLGSFNTVVVLCRFYSQSQILKTMAPIVSLGCGRGLHRFH